jgi:hypothetical protein
MTVYVFEITYVASGVFYEAVERPNLELAEAELEWRHSMSSATYSLFETYSYDEYQARVGQARRYQAQLLVDLEAGETNILQDKIHKLRAAGYGTLADLDRDTLTVYPTLDTTFKRT